MNKKFNKFIEEAANSVVKKEEEKIPNCPDGQYYDRRLKKCVMMAPRYGGRFWGGTFHKRNGNGNGAHNGNGNGNGNGGNGNGGNGNGNGGNGGGNGG
jgi:hypothetical protein